MKIESIVAIEKKKAVKAASASQSLQTFKQEET